MQKFLKFRNDENLYVTLVEDIACQRMNRELEELGEKLDATEKVKHLKYSRYTARKPQNRLLSFAHWHSSELAIKTRVTYTVSGERHPRTILLDTVWCTSPEYELHCGAGKPSICCVDFANLRFTTEWTWKDQDVHDAEAFTKSHSVDCLSKITDAQWRDYWALAALYE